MAARLARRRAELALEENLHNGPPTVVGAALVVPQGLLDQLQGSPPVPDATADKMETDRRAVAAVMKAERALGRRPEQQEHSNPGFDVLSFDSDKGVYYLIEVKGHLPGTEQISVSKTQVGKAQCNPDVWRLAVVSVPNEPDLEPEGPLPDQPLRRRDDARSPNQHPPARLRSPSQFASPALTSTERN